ncbi:sialate O-acetylesterase [Bifidobacterium callitrichos]|uniref:Sialic acidspecific 9-O-acetylesterase n=1 Tax=Bifidobacterium callitrichos DSM 23973 TaxID=1437609 RepID=A0A087AD28_9BIFI|nr:sialate O-acetylesterase [Bifidobacterium callitrichos]KFI56678.1 sialic acidspecific 9-O-acetylesterase [Bifidobacterium callitrichos DSM 23973]
MTETTVLVTGPAPGANLSGLNDHGDAANDAKPLGTDALRAAAIFSHDMVLQRRRPIPVFGTGKPGIDVRVRLTEEEPGESAATDVAGTAAVCVAEATSVVNAHGDWLALLPAVEASGPYRLEITSSGDHVTLVYRRVVVGEVWLAGGQSNMELELHSSAGADAAIAASTDPLLRFYNTPKTGVVSEELERHARWQVAGPDTSGSMSAIGYYFARKLRAELGPNVPVGIVDCYIGGTSITAWMSRSSVEQCKAGRDYLERFDAAIAGKTDEQFRAETEEWQTKFDQWNHDIDTARKADPGVAWEKLTAQYGECPWPPPETPTSQWRPTGAYGTMVERVAPYGIAGFLWYQGESDEGCPESYRHLLGMLIDEWRGLWTVPGAGSDAGSANGKPLPFLIVQLPQWIDKATAEAGNDPLRWPLIREAQQDAARTIADVSMITLIDCGEFDNLHPTDKRTPGERLADCALHDVYDRGDIAVDGPEVTSVVVHAAAETDDASGSAAHDGKGEGAAVTLHYGHAAGLHFDGTVPGTFRHDIAITAPAASNTAEVGADMGDTCSRFHRDAAESGFELAGTDGDFHPAEATIDAEHGTVTVRTEQGDRPTQVRYAWRSWGPAPLFNGDALPAPPFRHTL